MVVGGTYSLDYYYNKKMKKKPFQTVELKVRMDCDGCELKVKKALSSLSGTHTFFLHILYYTSPSF